MPEDENIQILKPEFCRVHTDVRNGRFRVHHQKFPGSTKSFSWNKRTVEQAVAEALLQMWVWESKWSGAICPLPQEIIDLAMQAS